MDVSEIIGYDNPEDMGRKLNILKIITHSKGGDRYRNNAMNYCLDDRCIAKKGYGINASDPRIAAMQFRKNAAFWGKRNSNPFIQYMHSYLKEIAPTGEHALKLTNEIMELFLAENLAITVVHEEDQGNSLYHSHTYVDATKFTNGKMIYSNNTVNYVIAQRTANVLRQAIQLIVEYDSGKEWTCPIIFTHQDDDKDI